jgi:mycothiol synthase
MAGVGAAAPLPRPEKSAAGQPSAVYLSHMADNADICSHPYREADLPALQSQMARWIAQSGRCGYDHIGELPHRIYDNLRGRDPIGDHVTVWRAGTAVAGLAITNRFGNAFDVFTAPPWRGTAAETTMLRFGFDTTGSRLATASTNQWVLTDVFECDTIRIRLLTELGFARFRIWDDSATLVLTSPAPVVHLADGFEVRGARLSDAPGLAEARNRCFDDTWTAESYRRDMMTRPGYDPAREIVAVAADGRIAAFAVYWADTLNRVGHFEPVGTHPDFQRRGLARAVMVQALSQMRQQGMRTVTINFNADNRAAGALYESLGFVKEYQTIGFRRAYSGRSVG